MVSTLASMAFTVVGSRDTYRGSYSYDATT